jgi:hypothetical protein
VNTAGLIRLELEALRRARTPDQLARLRVTPAVHEALAYEVCEGTDMNPLGVVVTRWVGVAVEIDPDAPYPGWIVDTDTMV